MRASEETSDAKVNPDVGLTALYVPTGTVLFCRKDGNRVEHESLLLSNRHVRKDVNECTRKNQDYETRNTSAD